ncbi:MAG TPA: AraC family transcriptional regulator [Spirochaetia bacterium]|nr:AraC family transcriptional regulator [Spirochaetia bacterium]
MEYESDGKNSMEELERARLNNVMVEGISRRTKGANRFDTAIPRLHFSRFEQPTDPTSYTMDASVCLIAQGSKRVMLGEDAYVYDTNNYLVTSVDLPVVAQIIQASPERPYLGFIMGIDQRLLAQLMVNGNLPEQVPRRTDRGIGVSRVSLPLLKAVTRLVELLDSPEAIAILAPLVQKEVFYHLLVGPQGPRLRQIVMSGTQGHQVGRAIDWLKSNFREQHPIDDLADRAHMSRSAFYHHFRSITSLSPLQYRKHLRLQEARRLMVVEDLDATTAANQVGYESPTQFNREYRRLFGTPPARDSASMREAVRIDDETKVLTG